MESLRACKDYGYIKNSNDTIDSIIDTFEDLQSEYFVYKYDFEEIDIDVALETLAKTYIVFVQCILFF